MGPWLKKLKGMWDRDGRLYLGRDSITVYD